MFYQNIYRKLFSNYPIESFVSFRLLFGLLNFLGLLWSVIKGDIQNRFWEADFYFSYYGLEFLPYPTDYGVVFLYLFALLSSLGIAMGAFYRASVLIFSFSFSYLHSIDATNFINHYYLIWIFSVYLFFVPANGLYSVDRYFKWTEEKRVVPYWLYLVFIMQIGIVYSYAGIAKLNPDWIFEAKPMKIWLGQQTNFPVIGFLFKFNWVHFAFSFFAAFYDLFIFWFLLFKKTRFYAYLTVLVFHILTATLFDIGLFPPLMIISCLLFFPAADHKKFLSYMGLKSNSEISEAKPHLRFSFTFLSIFLIFQFLLPMRHLIFTHENILWTQDYYRYGWRVMLVENEGLATFTVKDKNSDRFWIVNNEEFLTGYQIKRMSVQPEHIRQFANYLSKIYSEKYNLIAPAVHADVFVALNGRISSRLIDSNVDLTKIKDGWSKKNWILPLIQ